MGRGRERNLCDFFDSRLVRAVPLVAVVAGTRLSRRHSIGLDCSFAARCRFLQRIAAHSGTWAYGGSGFEKCRRACFRDANVAVGEFFR
jgi:hypothetical protein